jgi:hypothetical protein
MMRVIEGEAGERPVIQIKPDLKTVVDHGIEALAVDKEIFHRGGMLVRIVRAGPPSLAEGTKRPEGSPSIRAVATPTLRERLSLVARWERFDVRAKKWIHALPSDAVVQAVAARGEWPGLRPLVGIAEAPLLRADGSVLQREGYDEASGYFYMPAQHFPPVPDTPKKEDALRARDELLEVVCDFPFATGAHKAAWLAFLLTLFARPAIEGCVPLGAIDATTRGTGKGKLADATALIALGREAAKVPQPEDDKECRKIITSLVDEGEVFALFDNIAHSIAYASLDAALTATVWKDRLLGSNRTICAPMRITFAVTGNNLELGGDTARRSLHIRLESPLENPEDRSDFKHDLLTWVRAERPRLVVAALTILRGYVVAGRPDMGCRAWGSFEGWTKIIANAVRWVDLDDPQTTRILLEDGADATKGALAALMEGWARLDPGGGLTAKGAIAALYPIQARRDEPATPDGFDDVREAIETLCPPLPGKPPSSQRLTYVLRGARRRVIGGRMFDAVDAHAGAKKWRVVEQRGAGQ